MLASNLPSYPWLEILNPAAALGSVHYALFDFDGTISVIRHGWEKIMVAVMLECICEGQAPSPEIETEVARYVDRSTGILTILQMKWLEEAVQRHGIARHPQKAGEYKRIYLDRLLQPVYDRLGTLDGSSESRAAWMVAGAGAFLEQLKQCGVTLILASGTDQEYVAHEAEALGVARLFDGHIYGAQGDLEFDSKEMVIQRILADQGLAGEELLVVGDGPVEIRYARQAGALALGVACLEVDRTSLDPHKRRRLVESGADLIISNFLHSAELVELFCYNRANLSPMLR
jgi:phosphoglycolate phosphatase-like HAD superfamily hydrolase